MNLHADEPFEERITLICMRKLTLVAMDEGWRTDDPCCRIRRNPPTDGHKAWPLKALEAFEKHWPIGTPQRTAYAVAPWMGNRCSDVARLKWSDLTRKEIVIDGEIVTVDGFEFVEHKGRKRHPTKFFLPLTPMLEAELEGVDRSTTYVVNNTGNRRSGGCYTDHSLSRGVSL
ncbi:hypothetical protein [Mesorhizobium sp. CN2-181]|uniref:hypothetical protein n=1 Tax=Mesorhizobium yinganensis TaxID=3157707 RepID=UPI0032B7377E